MMACRRAGVPTGSSLLLYASAAGLTQACGLSASGSFPGRGLPASQEMASEAAYVDSAAVALSERPADNAGGSEGATGAFATPREARRFAESGTTALNEPDEDTFPPEGARRAPASRGAAEPACSDCVADSEGAATGAEGGADYIMSEKRKLWRRGFSRAACDSAQAIEERELGAFTDFGDACSSSALSRTTMNAVPNVMSGQAGTREEIPRAAVTPCSEIETNHAATCRRLSLPAASRIEHRRTVACARASPSPMPLASAASPDVGPRDRPAQDPASAAFSLGMTAGVYGAAAAPEPAADAGESGIRGRLGGAGKGRSPLAHQYVAGPEQGGADGSGSSREEGVPWEGRKRVEPPPQNRRSSRVALSAVDDTTPPQSLAWWKVCWLHAAGQESGLLGAPFPQPQSAAWPVNPRGESERSPAPARAAALSSREAESAAAAAGVWGGGSQRECAAGGGAACRAEGAACWGRSEGAREPDARELEEEVREDCAPALPCVNTYEEDEGDYPPVPFCFSEPSARRAGERAGEPRDLSPEARRSLSPPSRWRQHVQDQLSLEIPPPEWLRDPRSRTTHGGHASDTPTSGASPWSGRPPCSVGAGCFCAGDSAALETTHGLQKRRRGRSASRGRRTQGSPFSPGVSEGGGAADGGGAEERFPFPSRFPLRPDSSRLPVASCRRDPLEPRPGAESSGLAAGVPGEAGRRREGPGGRGARGEGEDAKGSPLCRNPGDSGASAPLWASFRASRRAADCGRPLGDRDGPPITVRDLVAPRLSECLCAFEGTCRACSRAKQGPSPLTQSASSGAPASSAAARREHAAAAFAAAAEELLIAEGLPPGSYTPAALGALGTADVSLGLIERFLGSLLGGDTRLGSLTAPGFHLAWLAYQFLRKTGASGWALVPARSPLPSKGRVLSGSAGLASLGPPHATQGKGARGSFGATTGGAAGVHAAAAAERGKRSLPSGAGKGEAAARSGGPAPVGGSLSRSAARAPQLKQRTASFPVAKEPQDPRGQKERAAAVASVSKSFETPAAGGGRAPGAVKLSEGAENATSEKGGKCKGERTDAEREGGATSSDRSLSLMEPNGDGTGTIEDRSCRVESQTKREGDVSAGDLRSGEAGAVKEESDATDKKGSKGRGAANHGRAGARRPETKKPFPPWQTTYGFADSEWPRFICGTIDRRWALQQCNLSVSVDLDASSSPPSPAGTAPPAASSARASSSPPLARGSSRKSPRRSSSVSAPSPASAASKSASSYPFAVSVAAARAVEARGDYGEGQGGGGTPSLAPISPAASLPSLPAASPPATAESPLPSQFQSHSADESPPRNPSLRSPLPAPGLAAQTLASSAARPGAVAAAASADAPQAEKRQGAAKGGERKKGKTQTHGSAAGGGARSAAHTPSSPCYEVAVQFEEFPYSAAEWMWPQAIRLPTALKPGLEIQVAIEVRGRFALWWADATVEGVSGSELSCRLRAAGRPPSSPSSERKSRDGPASSPGRNAGEARGVCGAAGEPTGGALSPTSNCRKRDRAAAAHQGDPQTPPSSTASPRVKTESSDEAVQSRAQGGRGEEDPEEACRDAKEASLGSTTQSPKKENAAEKDNRPQRAREEGHGAAPSPQRLRNAGLDAPAGRPLSSAAPSTVSGCHGEAQPCDEAGVHAEEAENGSTGATRVTKENEGSREDDASGRCLKRAKLEPAAGGRADRSSDAPREPMARSCGPSIDTHDQGDGERGEKDGYDQQGQTGTRTHSSSRCAKSTGTNKTPGSRGRPAKTAGARGAFLERLKSSHTYQIRHFAAPQVPVAAPLPHSWRLRPRPLNPDTDLHPGAVLCVSASAASLFLGLPSHHQHSQQPSPPYFMRDAVVHRVFFGTSRPSNVRAGRAEEATGRSESGLADGDHKGGSRADGSRPAEDGAGQLQPASRLPPEAWPVHETGAATHGVDPGPERESAKNTADASAQETPEVNASEAALSPPESGAAAPPLAVALGSPSETRRGRRRPRKDEECRREGERARAAAAASLAGAEVLRGSRTAPVTRRASRTLGSPAAAPSGAEGPLSLALAPPLSALRREKEALHGRRGAAEGRGADASSGGKKSEQKAGEEQEKMEKERSSDPSGERPQPAASYDGVKPEERVTYVHLYFPYGNQQRVVSVEQLLKFDCYRLPYDLHAHFPPESGQSVLRQARDFLWAVPRALPRVPSLTRAKREGLLRLSSGEKNRPLAHDGGGGSSAKAAGAQTRTASETAASKAPSAAVSEGMTEKEVWDELTTAPTREWRVSPPFCVIYAALEDSPFRMPQHLQLLKLLQPELDLDALALGTWRLRFPQWTPPSALPGRLERPAGFSHHRQASSPLLPCLLHHPSEGPPAPWALTVSLPAWRRKGLWTPYGMDLSAASTPLPPSPREAASAAACVPGSAISQRESSASRDEARLDTRKIPRSEPFVHGPLAEPKGETNRAASASNTASRTSGKGLLPSSQAALRSLPPGDYSGKTKAWRPAKGMTSHRLGLASSPSWLPSCLPPAGTSASYPLSLSAAGEGDRTDSARLFEAELGEIMASGVLPWARVESLEGTELDASGQWTSSALFLYEKLLFARWSQRRRVLTANAGKATAALRFSAPYSSESEEIVAPMRPQWSEFSLPSDFEEEEQPEPVAVRSAGPCAGAAAPPAGTRGNCAGSADASPRTSERPLRHPSPQSRVGGQTGAAAPDRRLPRSTPGRVAAGKPDGGAPGGSRLAAENSRVGPAARKPPTPAAATADHGETALAFSRRPRPVRVTAGVPAADRDRGELLVNGAHGQQASSPQTGRVRVFRDPEPPHPIFWDTETDEPPSRLPLLGCPVPDAHPGPSQRRGHLEEEDELPLRDQSRADPTAGAPYDFGDSGRLSRAEDLPPLSPEETGLPRPASVSPISTEKPPCKRLLMDSNAQEGAEAAGVDALSNTKNARQRRVEPAGVCAGGRSPPRELAASQRAPNEEGTPAEALTSDQSLETATTGAESALHC
ncbi:hypothetical protein BESB_004790 [Besnoitia besnoiti]|uniref:Uncharacterized protein n=1 Tax=Besnoitia besnoiti TaxID=94643 RepID=A0A2A9MHW5_BESBE|nr:hypothetical protein BESB_004790 [Besnoitia besnoiti]PFH38138.1 hypothetical protein BESB_004790 [Besnoitia besnoiti]